jgi:two-component system response regulator RpfG
MIIENYEQTGKQVILLHEELRQEWPQLKRIAIALYNEQTDDLHTFVNATTGGSPLNHYTRRLNDIPTLKTIADTATPRIVNDLAIFEHNTTEHSQKILQAGFRSSFTLPMFTQNHKLLGFIFYDADEPSFFTPTMQNHLAVYSELIQSLVMIDILPLKMVLAAVNMTQAVTRFKDEETSEHMARMAHYARLIAITIADEVGITDEMINCILLYSPLHDIGKVAVPDALLFKNGALTSDEFAIMQTHVTKGVEIVDTLISEFELDSNGHARILRNIVAYHHERLDGTGYPYGLTADDIPIESRIAAVADVFDALTSDRPYHRGRSQEEAFAYLEAYSGQYFDARCVQALIRNPEAISVIKSKFEQSHYIK